jgi:hypothetical protein
VAVSIFSLTAMSVDRYVTIQYPLAAQRWTSTKQSSVIIVSMWVVCSLVMGPILYVREVDAVDMPNFPTLNFCIENWPQDRDRKVYGVFLLFMVFVIPGFTLAACYAHIGRALCTNSVQRMNSDSSTNQLFSRKRAARMLIVLVVVFMMCWLPYNITSTAVDLDSDTNFLNLLSFSMWLGHAHSAINPVMYWSLNKRFRQRTRTMIRYMRQSVSHTRNTRLRMPEYV